jgi:hypothetical protein
MSLVDKGRRRDSDSLAGIAMFARRGPLGRGCLLALAWLLTSSDAHGYIDPGTGSYLFQILIAGIMAALFFFSNLRRMAKRFLHRVLRRNNPTPPPQPASPEGTAPDGSDRSEAPEAK